MVSEMVKSRKSCATEAISPENEQGETDTVPSYDGMVSGKLLLLILCVVSWGCRASLSTLDINIIDFTCMGLETAWWTWLVT